MTENNACPIDAFQQRLAQLDETDLDQARATLVSKWSYAAEVYARACVHCGLCSDSCHYFLVDPSKESVPAYRLKLVTDVFACHQSKSRKISGARELDRNTVDEWIDCLFGRCTLCNRCGLNCSVGINIAQMIRIGRSVLAASRLVPPELQSTVDAAVNTGNNMAISREEWFETIDWLNGELQQEVGDPQACLPLDRTGANILYAVNPREVKFFPLSLLAAAKIFHTAGENWTFSKEYYDVTNYALFSGDDTIGGMLSSRLIETARKLGVRTLVLGECGHGFKATRWDAPEWLAQTPEIEIKSVLEVVEDYIRQGRIRLNPKLNSKRVTLHDPCNLVRNGGIVEQSRAILKAGVSDFVEMIPNRLQNYCCGGGGGQLSMTRYAKRRLAAGKVKADQIAATGAKIVVAPCHNCIDQLSELNRDYKLGVEVKTVCEMVSDAIVGTPAS